MEFYEKLVKKVEENNITWCIPDGFLIPKDFDYTEKEKNQVNFIVDIVCVTMGNSDVSIMVQMSCNCTLIELSADAKDEDINGWDSKTIIWILPNGDKKLEEYIEKYGYYWGNIRYMLNYMPVPYYTLMSYFQESFMKAKNGDSFEYYIGGEKNLYYIRKEVISEYAESFYVYDKPFDKDNLNDYLYTLCYASIDSNDTYPTNIKEGRNQNVQK